MTAPSPARITVEEFKALVDEQLPLVRVFGYQVDHLEAGKASLRIPFKDDFIRPGGTVAGPVQMTLADLTMYAVVLSLIGRVELAVTTNLNCNFLRRPQPADLLAHGTILKLGKRLAVGEVTLFSVNEPEPVAHVTSTYSIPPWHV